MLSKWKKFSVSNLAWIEKVGAQTPLWKIQSAECLVSEKIPKKFFDFKFGIWKKVCPEPLLKSSESTMLCKWKNSEKFFDLKFGMTRKCWPRTPLWKIQSPECSVNEKMIDLKFGMTIKSWPRLPSEKFSSEYSVNKKNSEKIFGFKFGVTKKSWHLDPPLKNLESRVFGKWNKYLKKFLTSNLVWPKTKLVQSPLWKIQSPECLVNEKILKNFWPKIWHDPKN